MNTIRSLFALLLLVACSASQASGPKEGTYFWDSAVVNGASKHVELTLTKDKNGNFVVQGIYARTYPGEGTYTQRITGTMKKSGKLLAKIFAVDNRTNLNLALDLDGQWSEKANGILFSSSKATGVPSGAIAKWNADLSKKPDPKEPAGTFGLVSKVVGKAPGPYEDQGQSISGSMSPNSFSVTVTNKAPYNAPGTSTVTHSWSGALGSTLKPGDIIELTCTSTASRSSTDAPHVGSDCKWVVSGSAEVLEYEKSFAGYASGGKFYPNGSGKTRFKVGSGGTITITATHLGQVWGSSDNWAPVTYTYKFGVRPSAQSGGG